MRAIKLTIAATETRCGGMAHPPNMSVQRQQPKVFTSAAEPNYESRTPRPLMAGFWVGS